MKYSGGLIMPLQRCNICKGLLLSPFDLQKKHIEALKKYGCSCGGFTRNYYIQSGIESDSHGTSANHFDDYVQTKLDQQHETLL